MRLYLTRQHNGLYMVTRYPPEIAEVGNSGILDAYVVRGDPVGWRNFCPWSAEAILGVKDAASLVPIQVWLQGGAGESPAAK